MPSVYILHHAYTKNSHDETKLIGVYSSRRKAEAAIRRLRGLSGFRTQPDSFVIDAYGLDKDHWVDGFVSVPTQRQLRRSTK
jgi:homoserine kinase type II